MNSKIKYLLTALFVVFTFFIIDKKYKERKDSQSNLKQDLKTEEGQKLSENPDSPSTTGKVTGADSPTPDGVESPRTGGKATLPDTAGNPEVNLKLDKQPTSETGKSNQVDNTPTTEGATKVDRGDLKPDDKAATTKQAIKPEETKAESNQVKNEVKVPEKKIFQASPGEGTCDEQWQKYAAGFVPGSELVYMTNLAVQKPLAPEINTQHLETIKTSTSGQVSRDLFFTSDHPTGMLVLSSLDLASQIKYSKQNFLNFCTLGQGRAAGLAMFNVTALDIIDVTDATIEVGAGTFAAFKFNLGAQIQVGKKSTKAAAFVWVSRKKPGLVLKQTLKISSKTFPDHGGITFTSQLAGTKGIKF